MKTMKNICAILLLIGITSSLNAMKWESDYSKTVNVKKGEKLSVDINQGDIKVKTWDRNEVKVVQEGSEDYDTRAISVAYSNGVVSVRSEEDEDSDELGLEITVPSKFNVELKTRSGDIKLQSDIEGTVQASTLGGDLVFKAIKGDLHAETNGGDIRINGDVEGILDINTMGGDIHVGSTTGKKSSINTMGGDVTLGNSSNGVNVKTYGGDIEAGSSGGDSEFITFGGNVSVRESLGNIRMETNGGNLDLGGANGKVRAKTSGGNVNFKNIKGSVDVRTSAGEVKVDLDPVIRSESRITTNAGSIRLTIPATAKVEIEARIHVQGWWKDAKDNFKILSDFDTENYSSDKDTHEIVGKYILNGGGSKIFLRSVNDAIVIKKK